MFADRCCPSVSLSLPPLSRLSPTPPPCLPLLVTGLSTRKGSARRVGAAQVAELHHQRAVVLTASQSPSPSQS
eukprot:759937-Hanusia_phi.AAC.1